jgi:uncharacterized protein YaaN involved in tellurite resistance
MTTAVKTQDMTLTLPSMQTMKADMISVATPVEKEASDAVKTQANQWIDQIMAIDMKDLESQTAINREIKSLGGNVEGELVEMSKLLQAPMSELMADADSGGDVAVDLLKLEEYARDIDPNGYDFTSVSGFRRFLGFIGVPTPLRAWIAKYQSTESIIKSIETGLRQGKGKLERDNMTLKDDQNRYRACLFKLDDYIDFAKYVDSTFEQKLAAVTDPDQQRFLKDEILFPIRQRHQDLLTSKAVYQQAWVTSEFIIKTNEELVRGVDRALKHTLIALGVASSLAIALARQKRVLVALQSSKAVTEKMISDISDRLLEQGTQIMAQASEPYIQVEVLKSAFTKTLQAMDEVSAYRSEAITSMKTEIEDMKNMTSEMDKNINRIEQGQQAKEKFSVLLK